MAALGAMQSRSHAFQRPVHALRSAIRSPSLRPACNPLYFACHAYSSRRHASSNPNVAVLGGGITGLASAYYLTRDLPNAHITVYEAGPRVGGWMSTKRVDVDGGTVVFEQGPRTLRSKAQSAMATHWLIRDLELEDQVLITPQDSPAAKNRYIYYPDHLVKMPGPGQSLLEIFQTLLTEPLMSGVITGMLSEPFRSPHRPPLDDESVGDFLKRRTGSTKIGDNLVSAVLHGIYAGDIYSLSARSLFPYQCYLEQKYESIMNGSVQTILGGRGPRVPAESLEFLKTFIGQGRLSDSYREMLDRSSVFSFKRGIDELTSKLKFTLSHHPRVTLKTGAKIDCIRSNPTQGTIDLVLQESSPAKKKSSTKALDEKVAIPHDLVISTLSSRTLFHLARDADPVTKLEHPLLPSLAQSKASTVCVVNLFYRTLNLLPVSGFGYLLPRSVPIEQNPERALGVIFDSDAMPGQDTVPGTKLTVMLGGHWWDSYEPSDLPTKSEAVEMAQDLLYRHLGINEPPAATKVALQKDCIPQYTVGHEQRMKGTHQELLRGYGGKLVVAGSSYSGVGVNDCISSAKMVSHMLKTHGLRSGRTGLEGRGDPIEWVYMNRNATDIRDIVKQ